MVIHMRCLYGLVCLAAVNGLDQNTIHDPDFILVIRVCGDVHVVPGASPRIWIIADLLECLAAIFGTVDATVTIFSLHRDVDDVLVGWRNGDAHLAFQFRQPFVYLAPGCSAVRCFINAAARATAFDYPWPTAEIPAGCHQEIRVGRVHGHIGKPGVLVDIENFVPGHASICRFVNAAFFVWSPWISLCRQEDDIRVSRVNVNTANMPGSLKAHVSPGLARVG